MNNIILKRISASLFVLGVVFLTSCKKANNFDNMVVPQTQGHFMFKKSKRCFVNTVTDSFKIKIGLTSPSSSPATVTLSTSSPTATEGTHYKLSKKTIVFPAGKVLDSFYIMPATTAAANDYINGRRDSVIITITQPGVGGLEFNNTYTVQLREPCDPTLFTASDLDFFVGEFDNTSDGGNPYIAEVKSYTLTSATTAIISVGNLWEYFAKDMRFIVDWSNTSNITTKAIVDWDPNNDAVDLGFTATTRGKFFAAIQPNSNLGNLSPCDETITLNYDLVFWDVDNQKYVNTPRPYTTAFFLNQTTVLARKPE